MDVLPVFVLVVIVIVVGVGASTPTRLNPRSLARSLAQVTPPSYSQSFRFARSLAEVTPPNYSQNSLAILAKLFNAHALSIETTPTAAAPATTTTFAGLFKTSALST
jgi:hypothetical protein